MGLFFEKIPIQANQLFLLRSFDVPYMDYPLHYHPEIEITYIERGYGRRFVGDHIGNFSDGDLTMIGGNLPHQWQNDSSFLAGHKQTKLHVIHMRDPFFTQQQLDTEEFLLLRKLFENAERYQLQY